MNDIDIKGLESRIRYPSQPNGHLKDTVNRDFAHVLQKIRAKDSDIKFSKHAKNRMNTRKIDLSKGERDRLTLGFNRAQEKGVKDALILVGDKAFIASINNRTVITTVSNEQLKDNVFTNIDGAVIV
ncbi:MAG: flagellar protein [Tissierellia bacterium]|nr:flagellar protein [Tissierellia bacterium]